MEVSFSTWKTIEVGAFKDREAIIQAVRARGCKISRAAEFLLEKLTINPNRNWIELVKIDSAIELGITETCFNYSSFYEAARKFGLTCVTMEIGLMLCLENQETTMSDWGWHRLAMPARNCNDGIDRSKFSMQDYWHEWPVLSIWYNVGFLPAIYTLYDYDKHPWAGGCGKHSWIFARLENMEMIRWSREIFNHLR